MLVNRQTHAPTENSQETQLKINKLLSLRQTTYALLGILIVMYVLTGLFIWFGQPLASNANPIQVGLLVALLITCVVMSYRFWRLWLTMSAWMRIYRLNNNQN